MTAARRCCPRWGGKKSPKLWQIQHPSLRIAFKQVGNPSHLWPTGEINNGRMLRPVWTVRGSRKIINKKIPAFKIKKHGVMNGAVTAKRSGFRSIFSCEVCSQRDCGHTTADVFSGSRRGRRTLCSHTPNQHFFYATLLFLGRERLIRPQRHLKIHLCSCGKKKTTKKNCRLSVPPFLDRNLHAILSTFAGNDHSEWVMTLMTTLYYTQLVYMSPEGRNKPAYLNALLLCWALLTNISFQVLHRLEKRPGQLLWHRSSGGDHFHQRAPGQGEHRPT